MKEYKWGKGLFIIVICGLGGMLVGGMLQSLLREGNPAVIKGMIDTWAPQLFILAFLCGIIGLTSYGYFYQLLRRDGYSNEEGSLYERHEKKIAIFMTFSTVCGIVNFTAFGMNLLNELTPVYGWVFIANVVIAFLGEVANISLVKKVREDLNADPVDVGFHKNYFDKLDELEKLKTGKVSYQTMSAMIPLYIGVFVLCWLLIIGLNVDPIVCLPVGLLWLGQTVISIYNTCKRK